MATGKRYKQNTSSKYILRRVLAVIIFAAIIVGVVFAVRSCKNGGNETTSSGVSSGNTASAVSSDISSDNPSSETPASSKTNPSSTVQSQSNVTPDNKDHGAVVAKATMGSTGDILMHDSVLNAAKTASGYDFSGDFEYAKKYYSKYDLFVMNLEVTFGTKTDYKGYPYFNSPPCVADYVKSAGADLLLTANNHSYDTGADGFLNTVKVLKSKGIDYIGTRASESEPLYGIRTVNGIKVATACYTYSTTPSAGKKALNGNVMKSGTENLIASFDTSNLDAFYKDAEAALKKMKSQGAEVSVIYMHWGAEYQLEANSTQKKIAQKLCDMGWDAIIGSHPHVLEPFTTLKGKNGNETVCIYSIGNSISNQRKETLDTSVAKKGYTEDGCIFSLEFTKYADGAVKITDVSLLPTWVNYFEQSGKILYRVVALDPTVSDWTSLGVTRMADAKASYKRTMSIVGSGLNAYRSSHGLSKLPLEVK